MEISFNNKLKASILLMVSLFLSSLWRFFYGTAYTMVHPYVFRMNGTVGVLEYKAHLYCTMLWSLIAVVLFTHAARLAPSMRFGRLGELWSYYYVYLFAMILDFILTYRTSDFRIWTTILFVAVQCLYLRGEYKKENPI